MAVCRKPLISKREENRHQPENCRPNGDDSQPVDIDRRHGCLYQEVVVLGRLLHINHFSAVLTKAAGRENHPVLDEARLVSGQDVVVNRLETQLARLVERQIISAAQATELVEAAQADRLDGQSAPVEAVPQSTPKGSAVWRSSGMSVGRSCWVP